MESASSILLCFAWMRAAAAKRTLTLTDGKTLRIINPGEEDDIFPICHYAEIQIDNTIYKGDIIFGDPAEHSEIFRSAYNYAVLHVVKQKSDRIYLRENTSLPQLSLQVSERLIKKFESLKTGSSEYECGSWIGDMPTARRIGLLDRLLFERIDRKCHDVMGIFESCAGDWPQTLYIMLFRALGGNRNRKPYMELASRATINIVMRERASSEMIEALLLGTAGLLEGCYFDDYIKRLNDNYTYLSRKYEITPMRAGEWNSGGIRAQNRPVSRIVQLAAVLAHHEFLFESVMNCRNRKEVNALFDIEVSGYWATHSVPDGTGEYCPKRIGAEKSDLLTINAVVPVMFAYGQCSKKESLKSAAMDLLATVPAENNSIIRSWSASGIPVNSAFDSQALLQLRNEYCTAGRCISCPVGKSIIKIDPKAF